MGMEGGREREDITLAFCVSLFYLLPSPSHSSFPPSFPPYRDQQLVEKRRDGKNGDVGRHFRSPSAGRGGREGGREGGWAKGWTSTVLGENEGGREGGREGERDVP